MITKEYLLECIREMTLLKPEGWCEHIKEYRRILREMDDPFWDMEYHGSEYAGRRHRAPNKASEHDDYSEGAVP